MPLFSPHRRLHHLHRTKKNFAAHDFLVAQTWANVIDRLDDIRRTFDRPLILSDRNNPLPQGERERTTLAHATWLAPDDWLAPEILPVTPGAFDLVLSVFDLHAVNDPQMMLVQMYHALAPGGAMIAAFPGAETLHELRTCLLETEMSLTGGAHARVHPMIDPRAAAGFMQQAGFALPVVDVDRTVIEYRDFFRLLHDIRGMGEGNMLHDAPLGMAPRALFQRTAEIYHQKFDGPTGTFTATVDMIYLTGWRD
jgi:NADH dehydrogenase [ubiquinone] 1 alpha subcomplex assembly factor 5